MRMMQRLVLGICVVGACAAVPERRETVDRYAPAPTESDDVTGNPNVRDLREGPEPGTRYGTVDGIPQEEPEEPAALRPVEEEVLPVEVDGLFLRPRTEVEGNGGPADGGGLGDSERER